MEQLGKFIPLALISGKWRSEGGVIMENISDLVVRYAASQDLDLAGLVDATAAVVERSVDYRAAENTRSRGGSPLMEMMIALPAKRYAYSIKIGNIARNAIPATGAAVTIAAQASRAAMNGRPVELGITAGASAVAIAVGLHLARKATVPYEDACVLHLAWQIAGQDGPPYIVTEAALQEELAVMPTDYKVYGYTADKLRNSVENLVALAALAPKPTGTLQLREAIRFR